VASSYRFPAALRAITPQKSLLAATVLGIATAGSASAGCVDTIFRNGFESASTPSGFISDGSNFYSFVLWSNPFVLSDVGSSGQTAPVLAFVDGVYGSMLGLDRLYGTSPDELFRIDTTDGTKTAIGSLSNSFGESWGGFKQDPVTGTLYASSSTCGSTSHLYTVDRSTPSATLIGEITGAPCIVSIAIDSHGAVWGVDAAQDALFAIDKSTGVASLIESLGFDVGDGDIDFDFVSGRLLYAGINNTTGRQELRKLNPTIGEAALVAVLDVPGVSGLALENPRSCGP
jgi:hypothetical protein